MIERSVTQEDGVHRFYNLRCDVCKQLVAGPLSEEELLREETGEKLSEHYRTFHPDRLSG